MEALRVATSIDEAAHIVESTLRQGAKDRTLAWLALGVVGGGSLAAGVAALAGVGVVVTAPMLLVSVVVALVAAWADERRQVARWEAWVDLVRREAVPAVREAVLAASPDEALQLGRKVAAAIARNGARLPSPPLSLRRSEVRFLDGVEHRDPSARILAWLAAEVCGAARDRDRLVRCPFLMALKRAARDRVTADG